LPAAAAALAGAETGGDLTFAVVWGPQLRAAGGARGWLCEIVNDDEAFVPSGTEIQLVLSRPFAEQTATDTCSICLVLILRVRFVSSFFNFQQKNGSKTPSGLLRDCDM